MRLKESIIVTLLIAVIAGIISGIGAQSLATAGVFFGTALAAGVLTMLSFAGSIK